MDSVAQLKNVAEKIGVSKYYNNTPFAIVVIFALGAIVILSDTSVANELLDDNPLASSPQVIEPAPQVEIPQLTEDEENLIVEIAELDPRVQAVLAGNAYSIEAVSVWHTEETLQKIGGGVIFEFAEPVEVTMEWPGFRFEDTVAGTYVETTRHYRASNVTQLNVLVDLRTGTVASIGPGFGAVITP